MKKYLLIAFACTIAASSAMAAGFDHSTLNVYDTTAETASGLDSNCRIPMYDLDDDADGIVDNLDTTADGDAGFITCTDIYGIGSAKAGSFTTLTTTGQGSMTVADTSATSVTYADIASPLYVTNAWSPVGGSSSAVRFGVAGITNHAAAGNITSTGHYGGVLGYGYTNFAGLTDVLVIGVEGRCGAVLGDVTSCAANVATFDTNTENAGSIGIGVGYYLPDQSDDGHITTKFSFFSDDAAWTLRNDGDAQINGDIIGEGADQLYGFLQDQVPSTTVAITTAQAGKTFVSNSADVMTLPEASTVLGARYTFVCGTSDDFDINPADGTDVIGTVASITGTNTTTVLAPSAGDAIRCTDIGSSIVLEAVAANLWASIGTANGIWTDVN